MCVFASIVLIFTVQLLVDSKEEKISIRLERVANKALQELRIDHVT